ncbi:MAG: hypothetical protein A3I66_16385 [Burkholderiales bacterium RIFCSPLOWO2_02_FULL_57_36]|nr:MAG: hypothetical protein A3I66_16385 [Burkholderiales bacterium RIFCSPLOWO2_02_FULL_57_36]
MLRIIATIRNNFYPVTFKLRHYQPSPLVRSGIISGLTAEEIIMEAERLNSLAALLADLKTRETELRGYL